MEEGRRHYPTFSANQIKIRVGETVARSHYFTEIAFRDHNIKVHLLYGPHVDYTSYKSRDVEIFKLSELTVALSSTQD